MLYDSMLYRLSLNMYPEPTDSDEYLLITHNIGFKSKLLIIRVVVVL